MQFQALFLAALASTALATNIHPNKGCIDVNNTGVCQGSSVAIDTGSATFNARFDGSDHSSQTVTAGCQLDATWPSTYGDIYFGADNCLYDANGSQINGQCCNANTGGQSVNNPYFDS